MSRKPTRSLRSRFHNIAVPCPREPAHMDRFFMFTWRTYGTWVPGQSGFVGYYVTDDGRHAIDHEYGMPATDPIPPLERYSRKVQGAESVRLTRAFAGGAIRGIFEATVRRRHVLHAAAVMDDHIHVVFDAADPTADMGRMLVDWKAIVSFRMNELYGRRTWWAEKGSKRWYRRDAFGRIVKYVRDQEGILGAVFGEEAKAALAALEPGTE